MLSSPVNYNVHTHGHCFYIGLFYGASRTGADGGGSLVMMTHAVWEEAALFVSSVIVSPSAGRPVVSLSRAALFLRFCLYRGGVWHVFGATFVRFHISVRPQFAFALCYCLPVMGARIGFGMGAGRFSDKRFKICFLFCSAICSSFRAFSSYAPLFLIPVAILLNGLCLPRWSWLSRQLIFLLFAVAVCLAQHTTLGTHC